MLQNYKKSLRFIEKQRFWKVFAESVNLHWEVVRCTKNNKHRKKHPKMVPEMISMGTRWFKMSPRWSNVHLVAIFGHLEWFFGPVASIIGPRWAKIATLELQNGGEWVRVGCNQRRGRVLGRGKGRG